MPDDLPGVPGQALPPPPPRLTIRVGREVLSDVRDFVVIVRNEKNEVFSQSSSDSWALGAMESIALDIRMRRWHGRDGGDA